MIEERALIIATSDNNPELHDSIAKVKVQRTSACDSCSLKSGCGQSTLSKLSGDHCLELEVTNALDAKLGDEVIIAIPESGLINASFRVYFLPLLFMILGALLGAVVDADSESWTMLFSVSGLVIGFLWARSFSKKQASHTAFQPVMTRILQPASRIKIHSSHS